MASTISANVSPLSLDPLVEPAADLTAAEVERYSRHLIIPEIGAIGQRRLKNAKVLVIGAGGGVGSFAVQIAKAFGADVTGVCSTGKVELVRSLGADAVVDYTREDFAAAGVLYDVILDTAGNRPLSDLKRALGPRGTLVLVGGERGGKLTGGFERSLAAPLFSLFSRQKFMGLASKETHLDLEALASLIEAGSVKPAVDKVFALAEAPAAITYLREGRSLGKVVVRI